MEENEITQRLRASGEHPVPGEVRAGHLSQMHAATPASTPQPKRFNRLAVAAAAFVGFAVGSTGFAMAGALPDPAQGVAHDVLSVVQVEVPDRPDNHGKCISTAAKITDPAEKQRAKELCKESHPPGRSGEAPGRSGDAPGRSGEAPARKAFPADHPNGDGDDCTGKPPWAGKKGGPTPEQRAARDACPPDLDDDEIEEPEIEAEEIEPAPQGDAPAETPVGPPADVAPGQQDESTTPPVEVPAPIESETGTEAETDTGTETETEAG